MIGFVAPSGISFARVSDVFINQLQAMSYRTEEIRLSDYLQRISGRPDTDFAFYDERIKILQDQGDDFRRDNQAADALAHVGVADIRDSRITYWKRSQPEFTEDFPVPATAYLVWSLKHPAEVERFRKVYRSRFVLCSVFSPRNTRERALAAQIARSRNQSGRDAAWLATARAILDRDESEPDVVDPVTGANYGQNLREAYPLADFFIDASTDEQLQVTVRRTVEIVFGDPFATPTRDEFGMYVADAAAKRSAELGRQVGAAIASVRGDIIATGTNEVPAAGGGNYWTGDANDDREFKRGFDKNDILKGELAVEIATRLSERGLVNVHAVDEAASEMINRTRLGDVIEFSRAIHGEMSALLDAARRGVSVAGATIYVTTFPCHLCTGLVVGSGIMRLVYIVPYPKSRADDLHSDSIALDALPDGEERVLFQPFIGVSPRRYPFVFEMQRRKTSDGYIVKWGPHDRRPRLTEVDETEGEFNNDYILREQLANQIATWFGRTEDEQSAGT